jgi:hypothetical protein
MKPAVHLIQMDWVASGSGIHAKIYNVGYGILQMRIHARIIAMDYLVSGQEVSAILKDVGIIIIIRHVASRKDAHGEHL